jgi:hypothetical protein
LHGGPKLGRRGFECRGDEVMRRISRFGSVAFAMIPWLLAGSLDAQTPPEAGRPLASDSAAQADSAQTPLYQLQGVTVTARRVEEVAQEVPIKDYLEQLGQVAGTSGLYFGVPGDPRTWGVTFRKGS